METLFTTGRTFTDLHEPLRTSDIQSHSHTAQNSIILHSHPIDYAEEFLPKVVTEFVPHLHRVTHALLTLSTNFPVPKTCRDDSMDSYHGDFLSILVRLPSIPGGEVWNEEAPGKQVL